MEKITKGHGFTLIELMVVIVIIAILAVIGIAVYSSYALKGRRSDAISTMLSISLAEERYRSNNPQYGSLSQVWPTTTTPEGLYTLSVSNATATSYTITAQAIGQQANDKEGSTSCSTLQLIVSSGTVTKSPSACWPS